MSKSNYPKVSIIQSLMGNGITEPKLATLEDKTSVVLKEFNGNEGNLIIFNEYVCYRLALLVDLPMPKSGFCILDDSIKDEGNLISPKNYGYCFYSTFISKSTPLKSGIISLITNRELFSRLLIFDHIIYNSDRNPGNLLVQFYKNNIQLYIIDHSHVFKNQAIWDSQCLENGIRENDYFDKEILIRNTTIYDMFFKNTKLIKAMLESEKSIFQNKFTYDTIMSIINDCPQEIKPPQKDIDSLVKYLLYRVDNLDEIISMIIAYLKA